MFASIPSFGLGTFRLQGQTVIDSVATGLDVVTAISTLRRFTATRLKSARPLPPAVWRVTTFL